MIREPQQSLDLRREPEVPVPRVRVSAIKPLASDGEAWLLRTLAVARDLGRAEGSLTPSRLRERCATLDLKPPHPNHWGAFWARLKTDGWTRGGERASSTATRNAAREAVYLPPERA